LSFRSFLFVIPQLFVCHSAAFCLSFRSEAEESAVVFAVALSFAVVRAFCCNSALLSFSLSFVIPQQSGGRRNLLFANVSLPFVVIPTGAKRSGGICCLPVCRITLQASVRI
jgi:hypothetical protein